MTTFGPTLTYVINKCMERSSDEHNHSKVVTMYLFCAVMGNMKMDPNALYYTTLKFKVKKT